MKHAFVIAAVLLCGPTAASACVMNWYRGSCDPSAFVIAHELIRMAAHESYLESSRLESFRRQAAWIERCKPEIVEDDDGVRRRVYAAPNCESGP
jgi:hypothetical protein